MSAPYPSDRSTALQGHATLLCALIIALSSVRCAEPLPPLSAPPPEWELEGPRGQVDSPGPWLIRAFLPRDPSEVSVLVERKESDGEWVELPSPPLIQSLQSAVWLATLPLLSEGETLRYQLSGQSVGEGLWREVSYHSPGERARDVTACSVSIIEPRPDQVLSARDDVGQASGVQYTLIAQLSGGEGAQREALSGAVKLSVNLDSERARRYMSLSAGGRASFPSVTLQPGRQSARVEGFMSSGAYCERTFTLQVD